MRILLILILCLSLIGCQKDTKVKQPVVETPPVVEQPAVEEKEPDKPLDPNFSNSYVIGYNDGYNGRWIAPARWVIVNDYRAGWSDGNHDKKSGGPNKFAK